MGYALTSGGPLNLFLGYLYWCSVIWCGERVLPCVGLALAHRRFLPSCGSSKGIGSVSALGSRYDSLALTFTTIVTGRQTLRMAQDSSEPHILVLIRSLDIDFPDLRPATSIQPLALPQVDGKLPAQEFEG